MTVRTSIAMVALTIVLAGCAGAPRGLPSASEEGRFPREEPFAIRTFVPFSGDRWIGNAISYGPHRDGQFPGGPAPSRDELREDLQIMAKHWGLLRVYGAIGPAEDLLDLIQEDGIDMKVVLGVWIAVEEERDESGAVTARFPEARAANRAEVEAAVRLAAEYPEIIPAVCVGNETQIFWSAHRSPSDILIDYIREIRARTTKPVAAPDDFNFWNKAESQTVARELDFIVVHMHPLWNGLQVEDALKWTRDTLAEIRAAHSDRLVVLGETGWATQKHDQGEQAELMKGRAGEPEQKIFFEALTAWVEQERITSFFFEAFDENWKGGSHPNEVEKHWGLFRADRTPKMAVGGN